MFNGKESLLPSLTTILSLQILRYCLCLSHFLTSVMTFSLFIRRANFAMEQEACGVHAL